MAELDIWVDNRPLSVSVSQGDDQRVLALADELTHLISTLRTQSTGATEIQLLHLTALTLADEKHNLNQKLSALEVAQIDREVKEVQKEHEQAQKMAELTAQIVALTRHIDDLAGAPAASPPDRYTESRHDGSSENETANESLG